MRLILAVTCLAAAASAGRGWVDPDKVQHYPGRCQTDKVIADNQQKDCLRMHQVCNMKSGTFQAKLMACQNLEEIYPEPPKLVNFEKLEEIKLKKEQKLSVIAEKKQIKEERINQRIDVKNANLAKRGDTRAQKVSGVSKGASASSSTKAARGTYIKRCLPYGPGGEFENAKNFEDCNEFIRLVQDIKKFCVVKAQNIDPTFEYAAASNSGGNRKKRSATEMTRPGSEDDDDFEDSDDDDLEVLETSQSPKNVPAIVQETIKKFKKEKVPTQRKNAKKHMQMCRSKDFSAWFDLVKGSDKFAEEIAEQILKATEAKFDEGKL